MKTLIALSGLLAILSATPIVWAASAHAFDAASIKPADSGEPNPGDTVRNMDNSPGHFSMRNVPLRFCIEWAYDLKDYEVSGPDWIKAEERYDILANAPSIRERYEADVCRTLLTERFQMKSHRETRNVDVYALLPVLGAPKVQAAVADEQPGLGSAPGGGVKFTNEPISRFTFLLTRCMDRPALDMTGPKGELRLHDRSFGTRFRFYKPSGGYFGPVDLHDGSGQSRAESYRRRSRRSKCWSSIM